MISRKKYSRALFIDLPIFEEKLPQCAMDLFAHFYKVQGSVVLNKLGKIYNKGALSQYTLGLLCIASEFEAAGYECRYLNNPSDIMVADVLREDYSAILISCVSPTFYRANQIAKYIKKINPTKPILLGGHHATFCWQSILETNHDNFDILVLYEGEKVAIEAVNSFYSGQLQKCNNIAYHDGNCAIKTRLARATPERRVPSFQLLGDIGRYHHNVCILHGCLYNCYYCSNSQYARLGRPQFDVFEKTIKFLHKSLPDDRIIYFSDNILTISESFVREFSEIYLSATDGRPFGCDSHGFHLSKNSVNELIRAGCFVINVGVESADENVLRHCNKKIKFSENYEALMSARQQAKNILLNAYWIAGLPGSSKHTQNIDFDAFDRLIMKDIVDLIKIKLFVPYPGSIFYADPQKWQFEIVAPDLSNVGRFPYPARHRLPDRNEFDLFDELLRYMRYLGQLYEKKLGKNLSFSEDSQISHWGLDFNKNIQS